MTTILVNILLSIFCLVSLMTLVSMILSFADDRRREKRNAESEKRDIEYHRKRMNDFK